MGRGREVRPMTPANCRTVGAMIDEGVPVTAWCSRCGEGRPVDLDALAAAKGRGYSLLRKRAHCPACGELVAFHARRGPGVWRFNLSEADDR